MRVLSRTWIHGLDYSTIETWFNMVKEEHEKNPESTFYISTVVFQKEIDRFNTKITIGRDAATHEQSFFEYESIDG